MSAGPAGSTFVEVKSPNLAIHSSLVASHCAYRQSKFQRIDVATLEPWGRVLVLDGHMQSAERDEALYHESLVHPAVAHYILSNISESDGTTSVTGPKRVFIGGGGEGATCREVLRYASVEQLVMVDIDGECVDVCREFLPGHHQGSFKDPRCEVVIDDAKAWLERTEERFDLIILDLADPTEDGPCIALYTQAFYHMARSRLTEGGVLVTQAGPAGALSHHYCFTAVHNTLKGVFPSVQAHSVFVPAFVDHWGFSIGCTRAGVSIFNHSAAELDEIMSLALGRETYAALTCYDGKFHLAQSTFPKCIRQALADETRIVTEDQLVAIP